MNVYSIKSTFRDLERTCVKIGKSKNIQARIKELQTGSPNQFTLLGFVKCKSEMHSRHCETELHRHFKHFRMNGEWFHGKILPEIKSNTNTYFNIE